jgi:hypothetical protein
MFGTARYCGAGGMTVRLTIRFGPCADCPEALRPVAGVFCCAHNQTATPPTVNNAAAATDRFRNPLQRNSANSPQLYPPLARPSLVQAIPAGGAIQQNPSRPVHSGLTLG